MKIQTNAKTDVVNLALDTLKRKKAAIVFCGSKRSAQKQALDISATILASTPEFLELSERALTAASTPTDQCKKLASCLKKGIAFHHAGLHVKQRELIEDAFRAGVVNIICSTPTLAAGLDMPAFRTILKDVKRFSGSWGMQHIPTLEYEQMAGRAGRPGMEDYGEAILIATKEPEKEILVDKYIFGEVESIFSKLASEPTLRMYVLSLLASGFAKDEASLLTFFSKTFWATQFKDMNKLEQILQRVIRQLRDWKFLESNAAQSMKANNDDFVTMADLIHTQVEDSLGVTPLGMRVSQLYIDPLSAHLLLKTLCSQTKKLPEDMTQLAYFHIFSQALELRPQLRMKTNESEYYNQVLLENEDELILEIPTIYDVEYEDFFNQLKTASYFVDWISEKGEDELLKMYDIRPGEINAKNDIMDWILYCTIELLKVNGTKKYTSALSRLRSQLKYGVKEELLNLLRLKGVGRVRGRQLFDAQIPDVKTLKLVEPVALARIIGKKLTVSLKNQVGIDVDETTLASITTTKAKKGDSTASGTQMTLNF